MHHHPSEDRWQRLTLEGSYEEALAEAEKIFGEAILACSPAACVAPVLYTISAHNLAEVARRQGDTTRASELVAGAFERLVMTAESPTAPLALRMCCLRNLNPALAELIADLENGRRPEGIEGAIARAMAVTASVMRTAGAPS